MAKASKQRAELSALTIIASLLLVAYLAWFAAETAARNRIYHDPISLWHSAVTSSPNKKRTHENYGQALSTAGKLEDALKQLKTVLALPDEDQSVPFRDVYRELGVVYFRLGLIDESITAWKKGLVYAPMDAGLLNNISIALLRQRRFDEALSHALEAVRSNPYMPEPLNTAGEVYLSMGQAGKAAEHFMKYVQFRPEDSRGYWNAALALERAGDYERSIQYVSMFLSMERDPRYVQSAQSLLQSLKSRAGAGGQRK
jgi:tetratricopeptide (TPR) repeat protein